MQSSFICFDLGTSLDLLQSFTALPNYRKVITSLNQWALLPFNVVERCQWAGNLTHYILHIIIPSFTFLTFCSRRSYSLLFIRRSYCSLSFEKEYQNNQDIMRITRIITLIITFYNLSVILTIYNNLQFTLLQFNLPLRIHIPFYLF